MERALSILGADFDDEIQTNSRRHCWCANDLRVGPRASVRTVDATDHDLVRAAGFSLDKGNTLDSDADAI